MTGSDILTLIVGIIFAGYGVTIVVYRGPFTRFAKRMESTLYASLGRRVAEMFSPPFIAAIGVFFILFGSAALISLAVGHPRFPAD